MKKMKCKILPLPNLRSYFNTPGILLLQATIFIFLSRNFVFMHTLRIIIMFHSFISKNTGSPYRQDVNWTYTRRSEDIQDVFWTSYIRLIYILSLRGMFMSYVSYPVSYWGPILSHCIQFKEKVINYFILVFATLSND